MKIINDESLIKTKELLECLDILELNNINTTIYIHNTKKEYKKAIKKSKSSAVALGQDFLAYTGLAMGFYDLTRNVVHVLGYCIALKNMDEKSKKIGILLTIAHELRHKYQWESDLIEFKKYKNREIEAREFSKNLLNNNSLKISKVLGTKEYKLK